MSSIKDKNHRRMAYRILWILRKLKYLCRNKGKWNRSQTKGIKKTNWKISLKTIY